jgi:phosphoglucosamine mutase
MVARLFGTDGIRGVANVDLKPTLAYALGRATAHHLGEPGGAIVIGQDTRRSGDMFVAALAAGISSLGVDVQVVGVVPTPALAFLARTGSFAGGIMVSASHNPADDNGLKVLDRDGLKLDDAVEDQLEQLIWRAEELPGVTNAALGRVTDRADLVEAYVEHRLGLATTIDAAGLRIVLDGANGSGCHLGPRILAATGATVEVIHAEPDGVNINVRSGATDPASLAEAVVARGADVGFALDGDADRLIAVDAAGRIVDGDQVLGILALDRLGRDALPGGGLVVSVLSNGGLQDAVEAAGGQVLRTPVGDKYILEGMQLSGAVLGGEKSGHVIVLEHTTSGDGIVTALEVLRVMAAERRPLADLAARIPLLPQQQRAVKARQRDLWESDRAFTSAVADAQGRLGPHGRILVRPSGTEPSLRIMVEGSDANVVTEVADTLAVIARERLD